jgi:F-type H+-transporting ATPase subunit epsilon
MRLRIVTPMRLIVETDDIVSLRAEDETGAFGILPGHADFLIGKRRISAWSS